MSIRLLDQHGTPIESGSRRRLSDIGPRGSYYDGASTTHQDVALWNPINASAQSALSYERDRMASRLHDLGRNDGWASAAIQRRVDAIIGSGWRLSAKPNARLLGIDAEAASDLAIEIESAWRDYSEDFECCDAGQRLTVGGLLALAFRHRIQDGEALSISYWLDRGGDWCTAQMIVDPDRLSNPRMYVDMKSRRGGVELGDYGEPLAYWIRSAHPGDLGVIGAYPWKWDRFDRKLPNGRWQVVHAYEPKRAGQVRGDPPLAPVIKKLKMLGRYDEAELQAAVLNAVLAAFIRSPNDHDQIAEALTGGDNMSQLQEQRADFYNNRGITVPGASLNFLFPEDEIQFTNPNHPNSNFEQFFRAGLRNVAAAADISYEQLSGDYSQVNYSSLRGAFLEIWRGFSARKDSFAAMHMRPHYENWLEEAIARGRVKLPRGAPEFRAARGAYCAARWIGPGRGWVDPMKEAQAAIARLNAGITTYERECAEQGMDHIELFDQRARERKEMIERGLDPDAGTPDAKVTNQSKPAVSEKEQEEEVDDMDDAGETDE